MITVKQFFASCGLTNPPDRIKLVRHSGFGGRTIREIIADGAFNHYQADQDKATKPFHGCEVILSFIGIGGNRAEFHGAYAVLGSRPLALANLQKAPPYLLPPPYQTENRLWYELSELPEFVPLRGRIVAQWQSTRGWHQFKDLPIEQLLPAGNSRVFPGYQDVVLTFSELKEIISAPQLHCDWKIALSATAGIYRIVDHSSGKIYIGAAYGTDGIWGRWRDYAHSGNGGNILLKGLDPNRFQWSIIRTLSGSMSPKEVINIEQIEKKKHGSLAIGLNIS